MTTNRQVIQISSNNQYFWSEPQEGPFNSDYTFKTYVWPRDISFRLRLEGARYKSRGIARPLFLVGEKGMGKTHLLHAIGHDESEVLGHDQVRFVDCDVLDANFPDRADLERVSVLLVDNADFIPSWLRAILKSRAHAGRRSVVTGTSEKHLHANGLGELFGKRTVLKLSQPELRLRSLH